MNERPDELAPSTAAAGRTARIGAPTALRVLAVIATISLLRVARPLLVPIVIAMLFAFVLAPLVGRLRRIGIPPYAGAGIVVGSLLCTGALVAWLVAAPAAAWWSRAPATLQQLVDSAQRWRGTVWPVAQPAPYRAADGSLPRSPSADIAAATDPVAKQLTSEGITITRVAVGEVLSFTLSASAMLILLFFLLGSAHWLVARTLAAIPRRRVRLLLLSGIREAQRDIGRFVGTMSLVNVALGIATGVAVALIGLPNPVLWAASTAILTFVPYLGPIVVALVLLLAGSVTFGVGWPMLAPPAAFLALHGIEANFLSPMIMGRRLSLPALFVFLSVLVLGWLWGVAGAFTAVPLLLGLRSACRRMRGGKAVCRYLDTSSSPVQTLSTLLHRPEPQAGEPGERRFQR